MITTTPPAPTRGAGPVARRSAAILLLLVLVSLVATACDDGPDPAGSLTAEGLVVDVSGTISEVESFDILSADGDRLTLVPEDGALERSGFSPAHLREHMALAEPIAVRYEERDGRNVVVGFDDAG